MKQTQKVLVVGATGHLGSKVVNELLQQGKKVRVLIREGTDAAVFQNRGIEVVYGDLTKPHTLSPAVKGMDALITTAIGYAQRRKGDSLTSVDDIGNKNLIDAAKQEGLQLFVFTSILTADKAVNVPHFYQKKLVEDYLEASAVPFISLRPGGFLDSLLNAKDIANGNIKAMVSKNAIASTVLADDVAKYLVAALDIPEAVGKRIDIAADRPVGLQEIAILISEMIEKNVNVKAMPAWLTAIIMNVLGLFNPMIKGLKPSLDYAASGQYVADTTMQARLFGEVPTIEDSIKRWVQQHDVLGKGGL
ncbi:SDR family oxidoreductase [Ectobacillus sp. JY-23]|uniref:SDR family oxidoreductase n=1 Tax=Ectobacillus sp. JY-23 TaxID=2933872 RepID=UPI001FF57433|nr:SDR family oxidoreductase [Ectobacillus sp. JY-23]UOY92428.1 SDR family oxidoreductase [Ectobacillus sp. JY-23]